MKDLSWLYLDVKFDNLFTYQVLRSLRALRMDSYQSKIDQTVFIKKTHQFAGLNSYFSAINSVYFNRISVSCACNEI
jgi:hypothetical protein